MYIELYYNTIIIINYVQIHCYPLTIYTVCLKTKLIVQKRIEKLFSCISSLLCCILLQYRVVSRSEILGSHTNHCPTCSSGIRVTQSGIRLVYGRSPTIPKRGTLQSRLSELQSPTVKIYLAMSAYKSSANLSFRESFTVSHG